MNAHLYWSVFNVQEQPCIQDYRVILVVYWVLHTGSEKRVYGIVNIKVNNIMLPRGPRFETTSVLYWLERWSSGLEVGGSSPILWF